MGRFKGVPDLQSSAGFLATGILNATAGNAIAQGELCMLVEGAAVLRVDPSMPWGAINQVDPAPVPLFAANVLTNISLPGMTTARGVGVPIILPNGTLIVPVQQSGIGFAIRSSSGLQLSTFIQVSSDASNTVPIALALSNGNFAIFWTTGSTHKFAIYSPFGVLVTGATSIETSAYVGGQAPWLAVATLAGGAFIVGWCKTSGALVAQVFTVAGATSGSQIAIDSGVTGGFFGAQPCANGDFILMHFDSTAHRHKFYRITVAGVISWGPIIPSAATAVFTQPVAASMHRVANRFFELPNGNIACLLPNTSNYANIFILSNAGVLLSTVNWGTQYIDQYVSYPMALLANGIGVCHTNNLSPGTTYASYFDFNGNPININTLIDSNASQPTSGQTATVNLYADVAGPNLVSMRYYNNNGNVEVRQMTSMPNQAAQSSALTVYAAAEATEVAQVPSRAGRPFGINPSVNHQALQSGDVGPPHPVCHPDGRIFSGWFSVGSFVLTILAYKVGRSAVIGVAQNAASAGQAVTINAAGFFTLPSSQVFGPGISFDMRGLETLGCRGTVGGSTAILSGWV